MKKSDDIPMSKVTELDVSFHLSSYKSQAMIDHFNSFLLIAKRLYPWIHSTQMTNCEVTLWSKGFFIALFQDNKITIDSYQRGLNSREERAFLLHPNFQIATLPPWLSPQCQYVFGYEIFLFICGIQRCWTRLRMLLVNLLNQIMIGFPWASWLIMNLCGDRYQQQFTK
jgi:hypothetical protein